MINRNIFDSIYRFIFKLRLQIKLMSHDDFIKLIDTCDYQQLIYALYFRYCQNGLSVDGLFIFEQQRIEKKGEIYD